MTPNDASLPNGVTQQFTATARFSNGEEQDFSAQVVWTTDLCAVADIDSSGRLTGRSVGQATVTATSGAVSGATSVSITDAVPVSFAVTPASAEIAFGFQKFSAIRTYSDGTTVDVSEQAIWTSSNPQAAGVEADGNAYAALQTVATLDDSYGPSGSILVTSPRGGTSTISAQLDTVTASANLVVSPLPAPRSLNLNFPGSISAPGATRVLTLRDPGPPSRDLTSLAEWSSSNSLFEYLGNGIFSIAERGDPGTNRDHQSRTLKEACSPSPPSTSIGLYSWRRVLQTP